MNTGEKTMSDLIIRRLRNQLLSGTSFRTPEEVVAWMGAVQGQEYAFAKWALGLRMVQATDASIEQAFNAGRLLRTHVMRPTWHFVTPGDIRWLLELTAPRVNAFNAHKYRQLGLDQALFRRSQAALVKALQGGCQLTRTELREVFQQAGIATGPVDASGEHRMGHILMQAELDGVICSGPRRGKQFTYMLLEERAPHARSLPRDEALAELARRYFASHGPATQQDFAWWSGLTVADAKAGLGMLGSQVSQEVIDGRTYWFSAAEPVSQKKAATTHLLPILDEYTVAYKERSAMLDPAYEKQWGDVSLNHVILIDGRIQGTWGRELKRDAVLCTTRFFGTLSAVEQRAVTAEVQRYGAFLGLPVVQDE